jgi:formamidopyrimidine-DNA glycosylase
VPELPEVESLARFLNERMSGHAVDGLDVAAVSVLKTFDPSPSALIGARVEGVRRWGKFLDITAGPNHLVLHLARAGWIRWKDELPAGRPKPGRGPLALRLRLDDGGGFDLTEAGTQKRVAAYVVADPQQVEGVARLGVDPLSAEFTADVLGKLLAESAHQVKGALTDQTLVAGVGNAYSDEALHVAGLSPFRQARSLAPDEVARLHDAVVAVLTDALQRSQDLPAAGLKGEKKSGMRVHGRTGQPCPVCGDAVRQVAFADRSLQYCPTCQTGGKVLADRRLSRLLK